MTANNNYQHLEPRPGSNYRQWFIKGRRIRAEVLYRQTVGLEPRTPEEVAGDYDVSIEAVREAIDYCHKNEELLRKERDEELVWIKAMGLDKPPLAPPGYELDA